MIASEAPDWFRSVMLENGLLSSRPPILDAAPMSKAEILYRRREGWFLHEYGVFVSGGSGGL